MSKEITKAENTNLPATIGELSKFILVGREKLIAMKAEIRAIDKLKLAEDVHQQKKDEAAIIAELILDAEVRMGELLKELPKKPGKRTDLQPPDSGGDGSETKKEVIENLGLSEKQAERLETLAENPEIVEQVKAEARETGDIPTRAQVLEKAAKKKKGEAGDYDDYMDFHMKVCKEFDKVIESINKFEVSESRIEALAENFDGVLRVDVTVKYIEDAQEKLSAIVAELRKAEKRKKKA